MSSPWRHGAVTWPAQRSSTVAVMNGIVCCLQCELQSGPGIARAVGQTGCSRNPLLDWGKSPMGSAQTLRAVAAQSFSLEATNVYDGCVNCLVIGGGIALFQSGMLTLRAWESQSVLL